MSSVNFVLDLLRKTKCMCIQLYVDFRDLFFFWPFSTRCEIAVRTKKKMQLLTCGCGQQELRGYGLVVVDFTNYEVAVADSRILKRLCGLKFFNV